MALKGSSAKSNSPSFTQLVLGLFLGGLGIIGIIVLIVHPLIFPPPVETLCSTSYQIDQPVFNLWPLVPIFLLLFGIWFIGEGLQTKKDDPGDEEMERYCSKCGRKL